MRLRGGKFSQYTKQFGSYLMFVFFLLQKMTSVWVMCVRKDSLSISLLLLYHKAYLPISSYHCIVCRVFYCKQTSCLNDIQFLKTPKIILVMSYSVLYYTLMQKQWYCHLYCLVWYVLRLIHFAVDFIVLLQMKMEFQCFPMPVILFYFFVEFSVCVCAFGWEGVCTCWNVVLNVISFLSRHGLPSSFHFVRGWLEGEE